MLSQSEIEIIRLDRQAKIPFEYWKNKFSKMPNLSNEFVELYWYRLDWGHISNKCRFSNATVREHWTRLSMHTNNADWVRAHKNVVNWWLLNLDIANDAFVEEFEDVICWDSIFNDYAYDCSKYIRLKYAEQFINHQNYSSYDRMPSCLYKNKSKYMRYLKCDDTYIIPKNASVLHRHRIPRYEQPTYMTMDDVFAKTSRFEDVHLEMMSRVYHPDNIMRWRLSGRPMADYDWVLL
jgi:hypothetical protein